MSSILWDYLGVKTVILAGGLGTRLREETEFKPKPMVEIGGMPILWHIMKHYSFYGFNEFEIALGFKGSVIKDFFLNFERNYSDLEIVLGKQNGVSTLQSANIPDWKVALSDTGAFTPTGGRLYSLRDRLNKETFFCTYGDGVSDLSIQDLLRFHKAHGKMATVTAVTPTSRFGRLQIGERSLVEKFEEKPDLSEKVSGGFFCFEPEVLNYLSEDSVLEAEPLESLAKAGELFAYSHAGFWQPMDTLRDSQLLNTLWNSNQAKWKIWKD